MQNKERNKEPQATLWEEAASDNNAPYWYLNNSGEEMSQRAGKADKSRKNVCEENRQAAWGFGQLNA